MLPRLAVHFRDPAGHFQAERKSRILHGWRMPPVRSFVHSSFRLLASSCSRSSCVCACVHSCIHTFIHHAELSFFPSLILAGLSCIELDSSAERKRERKMLSFPRINGFHSNTNRAEKEWNANVDCGDGMPVWCICT